MKYFEKRIKNFTIIQNKSKLIINYSKTAKDWFDSIIILLIGLSLFVVTYFLMSQGIKTNSFMSIGGGLIFVFRQLYNLPFKYDFAYKFSSGLACVEIDKKRGFIDKTGKVVIPIIYDETGAIFDNDEMEVEKDGRKFYIDKTGKEIE